jgi:hypothetical protein
MADADLDGKEPCWILRIPVKHTGMAVVTFRTMKDRKRFEKKRDTGEGEC